jgi:hypothetical protein
MSDHYHNLIVCTACMGRAEFKNTSWVGTAEVVPALTLGHFFICPMAPPLQSGTASMKDIDSGGIASSVQEEVQYRPC